jgi:hypothetical protein
VLNREVGDADMLDLEYTHDRKKGD